MLKKMELEVRIDKPKLLLVLPGALSSQNQTPELLMLRDVSYNNQTFESQPLTPTPRYSLVFKVSEIQEKK